MFDKVNKKLKKSIDKAQAERMERCIPVAKKIITLISESNYTLGDITDEHRNGEYGAIAEEVLGIFLEADINYVERQFVFQLVLQAIEETKDKVLNSLDMTYEKAMSKVLNNAVTSEIKDVMDIKMSDINEILLEGEDKS